MILLWVEGNKVLSWHLIRIPFHPMGLCLCFICVIFPQPCCTAQYFSIYCIQLARVILYTQINTVVRVLQYHTVQLKSRKWFCNLWFYIGLSWQYVQHVCDVLKLHLIIEQIMKTKTYPAVKICFNTGLKKKKTLKLTKSKECMSPCCPF